MSDSHRVVKITALVLALTVVGVVAWFLVTSSSTEEPTPQASASPKTSTDEAPEPSDEPGVLEGTVTEMPSGLPVENADVKLTQPDGELVTQTDAEGRFQFEAHGEFGLLHAEAPGLRSAGRDDTGLRVRIPSGQVMSGVDLVLHEPGEITGRVELEDRPAEARVTLHYVRDQSGAQGYDADFSDTNVRGRFRLLGLAPGRVTLRVSGPGAAPFETNPIDLFAGDAIDVGTIELRPGATVLGRVLDSEGHPIEGASVRAIELVTPKGEGTGGGPTRRGDSPAVAVRTDAQGIYGLYGVPSGTVELRASAPGRREAIELVELDAGQELAQEFRLEPLSGIVVHVLEPGGAHATGATVTVYDEGADPTAPVHTGVVQNDALVLADLEGGPFRVEAARGEDSAVATVIAGETAELVLGGGEGVLRALVLAADGNVANGADVGLYGVDESGERRLLERHVVEGGYLRIPGLAPGTYILTGSHAGHRDTESEPFEVADVERSITLRLARGGVLTGAVTDATTGQPIAGATVGIDGSRRRVLTGEDGSYRLAGFPDGRHSIHVSAAGYRTEMQSGIEVADGDEAQRDISLTPSEEGGAGDGEFEYVGVGLQLSREDDGSVVVQSPLDGSPAANAGLEVGDRVLAIDGEDVSEIEFRDVIEKIRGEQGSIVRLRVQRSGADPFEVELERKRTVYSP